MPGKPRANFEDLERAPEVYATCIAKIVRVLSGNRCYTDRRALNNYGERVEGVILYIIICPCLFPILEINTQKEYQHNYTVFIEIELYLFIFFFLISIFLVHRYW